MAQDNQTRDVPSMDEILASVREIIDKERRKDRDADDGDGPANWENVILDLEEIVDQEDTGSPRKVDDAVNDDPVAGTEPVDNPEAAAPEHGDPDVTPPESRHRVEETRTDSLLSPDTHDAVTEAFARLHAVEDNGPAVDELRGRTVEELVLDQLKPMLQNWLNANLPDMVERIVEREIRSIAGRGDRPG